MWYNYHIVFRLARRLRYGYGQEPIRLCRSMYGYVGLCRAMKGYVGLCRAMYGFVGLCWLYTAI